VPGKVLFPKLLSAAFCAMAYGPLHAAETAQSATARTALKVCADPFSLPSSNKSLEGYENKIAELFGKDLGLPVQYEWFPQRLGFIRKTLKNNETPDGSFKCDLVMGEVDSFDAAATTNTYFRSTWAMVYVKGRGLDDLRSQADLVGLSAERKKQLRIGLFDQSPASIWLSNHSLLEFAIPYQTMTGDVRSYPGQIIENDLLKDKINLTFVWGPIAGYFAKKINESKVGPSEVVVVPMQSEPGVKFDFGIAMAVRFGEKAWKEQINGLIAKHASDIRQILVSYGVPLLEK
jgi:mxaJ protein